MGMSKTRGCWVAAVAAVNCGVKVCRITQVLISVANTNTDPTNPNCNLLTLSYPPRTDDHVDN